MRTICSVVMVLSGCALFAACGGRESALPARLTSTQTSTPLSADATSAPTSTPLAGQAAPPADAAEPDVYLVGLGEFPGEMLIRLEAYFEGKYGVSVGILASIDIPADAYDGGQLVAALVSVPIQAARVEHPDRPVIALTEEDLVIEKRTDAVFSARSGSRSLAVVSVARMNPVNLGLPRDDELLFMRMAKMVAKDIGVLYLGLPLSNDPRSVMYNPINSLADLDAVADDFVLVAR